MKQKYTGFKRAAVCFFALLAVCLAGTALGKKTLPFSVRERTEGYYPGRECTSKISNRRMDIRRCYDSGGRLVQVERCAKTQDGYTFHLPGGIEDGTLKLFCWEGEKSIRPLCQSELIGWTPRWLYRKKIFSRIPLFQMVPAGRPGWSAGHAGCIKAVYGHRREMGLYQRRRPNQFHYQYGAYLSKCGKYQCGRYAADKGGPL